MYNINVTQKQYKNWISFMERQGYLPSVESKGGMLDLVQVSFKTPTNQPCRNYSATSFIDAAKGRRVHVIQIRVETLPDAQISG